jgi:hypothetical protein
VEREMRTSELPRCRKQRVCQATMAESAGSGANNDAADVSREGLAMMMGLKR